MFERPTKNDLDRTLSQLMHESRHKLMDDVNRIKADAIKAGTFQSNRVVVSAVQAADGVHAVAMGQAQAILLDFIERIERPPSEIVTWARPHLENLGNSVLGVVPPNNFPQDHQRLTHQYRAVFQQRLDGMLRDVEIGFVKGAGFARAEKMETKEEWVTAAEARQLLKPVFNSEYTAQMTICERAHAGLIRSRARHFIRTHRGSERRSDNCEISKDFWWGEGHEVLKQTWTAGDFEAWTRDQEVRMQAFAVSFLRADIEKMIPAKLESTAAPTPPSSAKGGRPPADWWEDLLIAMCFRHFRGDLQPKKQADIEGAMKDWITQQGYDAADSTIRSRAKKVWQAIQREAEN
jgi:hypothetical protein